MKTKLNTSKFKILLTLVVALVVTSVSWITNPISVKADDVSVLVEGYSADSDITSSDGYWYSTYCKGAGYKGQGVLIYLIERNGGGAVPGTQPVAFACDPVMKTYELHAQDKFNRYPEVTTWKSEPVPWKDAAGKQQGGGLIKSSTSSNLNAIKSWLSTEFITGDGKKSTNGIAMVHNLWPSASTRFVNEEVILVVEVIVANQFSQSRSTGFLEAVNNATSLDDLASAILSFQQYVDIYKTSTAMSNGMSKKLSEIAADIHIYNSIPDATIKQNNFNAIKEWIVEHVSGDRVYFINYPEEIYCGTPKRIIDFYNSYTPQLSQGVTLYKAESGVQYYRRAAHQSAFIKDTTVVCKDAIPLPNRWPSNKDVRRLHTDDDIRSKSIGMFAMLAWHQDITGGSSQTTCDEPNQPLPHPAPNESTGTCTIIKSYRTKTATGTLIDPSTHTKDNTSETISIEEEEEYKVIGWKISDTRNPSIDARYWETTVRSVV